MRRSRARRAAVKAGYRSAFEFAVAEEARKAGLKIRYEPADRKVKYVPKQKTYLPDFELENGVLVETKGRLTTFDRTKHLLIAEQHPELDIRFVLMYDNKLDKDSETRYSEWMEKHGFKYHMRTIPPDWCSQ